MRRSILLGVSTMLLLAACAQGQPVAVSGPQPEATASVAAPASVEIYIAVLRRYLTSPGENSFPGGSFSVVFLLDRTDVQAADPMRTVSPPEGPAIAVMDQERIIDGLRDVATVRFVASRSEAILHSSQGCDQVRDGGILVLLSRPVGAPDHVEVGINGFVTCLGATWLTYVAERSAGGWTVTDTTGSRAIS